MNLWWIWPGMVAASLTGAGIAQLQIKRQQRRDARVQQQRAQRLEDIETRAAVPAAPDNTEGINRGDWDDCELILNATNEAEAGWQRLINDLRKEDT